MNILNTLLDIPGKSKNGLNARRDLVDLKLRSELAPISSEKKIFIPHACYTLTKEEKRCVLKTLSRIKVPEGYSSNIRNLVSMTDLKLNSLNSHDCHVLIQQLFPIAIRSVLPKHVRYAITRLCIFFNSVCNKVLDAQQLDKLEEDIVVSTELEVGNSEVSDNLRWIDHGPHPFVITYSGYAINGCRYHTKSSEKDQSVHNSGELNYNTFNVVLFKCDWVQNNGGVRIDEDPSDVRWSVVLTPPQRDFEDRYNDNELGDTILRCEGMPNDMSDVYLNNDLDENVSTVGKLNATVEEIDTINEIPKELKRRRRPTIMFDVTRIRSLRDKKVVRYNEDGAPIELKDKIFTTVEAAFVIDPRSTKNVLQTAVRPEKYSFIKQNHWEEFVRSRLSETFRDEIAMNTDSSSVNRHCSNDVLTQALGTKEHNGRVRGVGGYVTSTTYFHSVKKTSKDEANILVENEELRRRVSELEAQIRSNLSTPLSAHESCSRPIMLEGIEEKDTRIEVESLDKPKEKEKKGRR
ncbi:transposase [Cucumis melo var. makuwa]|uniref:Transposase n=1 Tax=Cucumis melo var. makuwa TaxID=1194695 RepID=A0A5D3CST0_CUCMM|nr:transposase [Cucumis melo var. makuwa]